jgi:hypothetical protein
MPSPAHLLDAWEHGRRATPGERGLLLLEAAEPSQPAAALAGWSTGERDAALLRLRERLFGPSLAGVATCTRCGEPLDLEFDVGDVLLPAAAAPATLTATADGVTVTFRVPTAGDLAELGRTGPAAPERWLLERCLTDGGATGLPPAVAEAVSVAMERADPRAETVLELTCPACAARWTTTLDIVEFLWLELESWALRMLDTVAALASAFGWSERDILALSPWRRRHYLELIGA